MEPGISVIGVLAPFLLGAVALLLMVTLRSWHVHDRGVDMLLALSFVVITAIIAGSVDLGTDASGYRNVYDQLPLTHGDAGWWEPGFKYLALLFSTMGAPYGLFVFSLVLASHLLELSVYSRTSSNITLTFFALFCFNIGEVAFVRQYLAASLLLLSFYFLHQRRTLTGLIIILCATLIHKSALPIGALMVLISYGRRAIKPSLYLLLLIAITYFVLPAQITSAFLARIITQIAAYTAQGFVQGLQGADVSLFRNVAKFLVYALLALWMLAVPVRTRLESAQAKAAYLVLAISVVSLALIVSVSPVFSRLSAYVFPFLALSMRVERFAPRYSEIPVQLATVTILLANLYVSTYPLAPFL